MSAVATQSAAEILKEYRELREHWLATGEGSYRTRNAYERYVRQSFAEGVQPDSLQRVRGPENERFFELLIQGVDGHVYWQNREQRFWLDSGLQRHPRYWWYEHLHGKLPRGSLKPTCGQMGCITPTHQTFTPWSIVKRRYTDEQLIGAVQVVTMRLGRPPTQADYEKIRGRGPDERMIVARFGSWVNALEAAGCDPSAVKKYGTRTRTPEQCIEALRYVAELVGRTPSDRDYRACAEQLRERGLPPGVASIRLHVSPHWGKALEKAGLA